MKNVSLLAIFLLNQVTFQQCLDTTTLTALGFSGVKSTPEKIESPFVCKSLIPVDGTCVEQQGLKDLLLSQQETLFKRVSIKKDVLKLLN